MSFEEFEKPSRVVPLQGGINFRDLGGYRTLEGRQVKWRKLFRAGHLAELTDADAAALEHLRVTQVHDFRRSPEQERAPSKTFNASFVVDYQMYIGSMTSFWDHLQQQKLDARSAHALVVTAYGECIHDVAPHYRRLLLGLLENADNATLFHCAAGKDRTGIAAALILSALGVPRETVIEDYLLTLEHYDSEALIATIEKHLRDSRVSRWEREWLQPYASVHRDNIEAFFRGVDSNYGGVDRYLENAVGISAAQRQQLQNMYLSDG